MTAAWPGAGRWPCRIDRYLFALALRPMAIGLGVALLALLAERLVRLLDLAGTEGAPLAPLLAMLVALLPHYLGLALPAAFALGLLVTVSRLSSTNELDALEAAGWSIRRTAASFVVSGAVLAVVGVALFGYLQPHARYAYRDARHALLSAGWTGTVPEGQVVSLGGGVRLSAARVTAGGNRLEQVFVVQPLPDGRGETVTTAARGLVAPDPATGTVRLLLEDGVSLTPRGVLRFESLVLAHDIAPPEAFRPRGELREQTLSELAALGGDAATAELHARIARAFSLLPIALAMVPLGVLRKRAPVWPRVVVALAGLTLYHHALLLAQELGAAGHVPPVAAIWGVTGAFLALALWLYATTPGQAAATPLRRLLRALAPGPFPSRTPRIRHEPTLRPATGDGTGRGA